jgi:hypothetical protein
LLLTGVAASGTAPAATHSVCSDADDAVIPSTETEHQLR